jgi:hypothetical protein
MKVEMTSSGLEEDLFSLFDSLGSFRKVSCLIPRYPVGSNANVN